jgi:predicted metal-dependent phosphoesterase TrpH
VRTFKADLHVHTALSPCADDEMTPPAIVEAALQAGLEMIAICDHNAAGNARAVQEAAGNALAVIAGIEITTAEEVHMLGLFPTAGGATGVADAVRATLPRGRRSDRGFGPQCLMDSAGRTIGTEDALLSAASALDLAQAVALIREGRGLAVAAHVDRPSFSVLAQLGMMPAGVRFDAVEVSAAAHASGRAGDYARLGLSVLCSSDSHWPAAVGTAFTRVKAHGPGFGELTLALAGRGGRGVFCA